ncbi:hypothetical protein HNQ91_000005 [Filimonas zeae]|uniref:Beta-lactamase-inhibitor-like PepSY-like domain-containing protein n=1 Tax=Filimonas zeae TaxID=1737353 RepID=A0A917MPI8_9BACT|nr:hypothetical protein [Filimonas zeae]MDR6336983.1 hypothetical protein [Filimonas zeae]GGH56451.1 hypothetical protein GCM10011379_00050 [Filimonas zeae]
MKNVFICAFMCVALFTTAHAQFRKTPSLVLDAFHKKYPTAEQAAWKNKDRVFQVAFIMLGVQFEAEFSETGTWLQCAQDILPVTIPDDVMYGVGKTQYKGWDVKEAAFITLPEDKTEYRLLLFKNVVQQKYLFFDPSGELRAIK